MTRKEYENAVEFLLKSESGDWIMGDGRRCVEVVCEDGGKVFYLTDDNTGELIGTTEDVLEAVDFINVDGRERERIYREVRHEYLIEDAEGQVLDYLGLELDPAELADKFDFEYLVARFEKCHDCNVAENDMWREIIGQYIDDNFIGLN